MLAEECPNIRCFGVPLVRPPKAGGGKDPRKARIAADFMQTGTDVQLQECVICGTVYVSEKDSNGWEQLVPLDVTVPEQLPNDPILAPPSVVEAASFGSPKQGNTAARDELPRVSKIREFIVSFFKYSAQVSNSAMPSIVTAALEVSRQSIATMSFRPCLVIVAQWTRGYSGSYCTIDEANSSVGQSYDTLLLYDALNRQMYRLKRIRPFLPLKSLQNLSS
jgi:hypothetical protein